MKKKLTRFDENDLKHFEPEAKVGVIATVNPEGLPHITLITALQAKTPTKLIWGQFSEGQSKQNVKTNPKTGFLIMTLDRSLWRGKAIWTQQDHPWRRLRDVQQQAHVPVQCLLRYSHRALHGSCGDLWQGISAPGTDRLGSILTTVSKSAARQKNAPSAS